MNLRPISFRRRGRARAGMVLLEVVIAMAIFITVALSLVIALNSGFDAAEDRNQVDKAVLGLQNQLELLHSARLQVGEQDLPDDGSGILYHLSIAQEVDLKDQKNQFIPNLLRATITATWKLGAQAGERDVSELVYQP
jgi:type II secretory pathway pseudopilin PulG